MRTVISSGVLAITLDEHEWDLRTEAEREHIQQKALLQAQQENCTYVSVFVQPDSLFGEMPDRKRVFVHTFPRPVEEEFRAAFVNMVDAFVGRDKLTVKQAATIVAKVLGQ